MSAASSSSSAPEASNAPARAPGTEDDCLYVGDQPKTKPRARTGVAVRLPEPEAKRAMLSVNDLALHANALARGIEQEVAARLVQHAEAGVQPERAVTAAYAAVRTAFNTAVACVKMGPVNSFVEPECDDAIKGMKWSSPLADVLPAGTGHFCVSPDGQLIAFCIGRTVTVVKKAKTVAHIDIPRSDNAICALAFSSSGKHIVVAEGPYIRPISLIGAVLPQESMRDASMGSGMNVSRVAMSDISGFVYVAVDIDNGDCDFTAAVADRNIRSSLRLKSVGSILGMSILATHASKGDLVLLSFAGCAVIASARVGFREKLVVVLAAHDSHVWQCSSHTSVAVAISGRIDSGAFVSVASNGRLHIGRDGACEDSDVWTRSRMPDRRGQKASLVAVTADGAMIAMVFERKEVVIFTAPDQHNVALAWKPMEAGAIIGICFAGDARSLWVWYDNGVLMCRRLQPVSA